jgi:hypothetical protein
MKSFDNNDDRKKYKNDNGSRDRKENNVEGSS